MSENLQTREKTEESLQESLCFHVSPKCSVSLLISMWTDKLHRMSVKITVKTLFGAIFYSMFNVKIPPAELRVRMPVKMTENICLVLYFTVCTGWPKKNATHNIVRTIHTNWDINSFFGVLSLYSMHEDPQKFQISWWKSLWVGQFWKKCPKPVFIKKRC